MELYFTFCYLCNKLYVLRMEQKVHSTAERNSNFIIPESGVGVSCIGEKRNSSSPHQLSFVSCLIGRDANV